MIRATPKPETTMSQLKIGDMVSVVAAGSGRADSGDGVTDNVKVTGTTIDRLRFPSGVLAIVYEATLTDEESISFAVERQESSDDDTWDAAVVVQALTIAETSDGGGSVVGILSFSEDLSARKRYVRYNITPDLSAPAPGEEETADTASWGASFTMGGGPINPVA
jgi:hypothetical protein